MQMHSLTQTWTGIQRGRNWLKEEYGGFGGGRAPLYLEAGAYLICRLFFKEVSGLT